MPLLSTPIIEPGFYRLSSAFPGCTTDPFNALVPYEKVQFDQLSLVASGRYTDTYKSNTGVLCNDGVTRQLVIKIFRVPEKDTERIAQATSVIHELLNQRSLVNNNHVNICSTEIINTITSGHLLCGIVMPWYNNGNVLNYVRKQPLVNKLDLVVNIAKGLKHIHSAGLVHGNLHAENILVTDAGLTCITDIRLDTLAARAFYRGFNPVSTAWAYKAREELMSGIRDQRTDVYSLACVIYAIYIAGPPLQPLRYPYVRGLKQIVDRGHLQLLGSPEGMGENLWGLLRSCWSRDPDHRPSVTIVEHELLKMQRD